MMLMQRYSHTFCSSPESVSLLFCNLVTCLAAPLIPHMNTHIGQAGTRLTHYMQDATHMRATSCPSHRLFWSSCVQQAHMSQMMAAFVIGGTQQEAQDMLTCFRLQQLCLQSRNNMAHSLRYVAHMHGASLVYLGGLKDSSAGAQGSLRQKDAASDKATLANFRSMLSHMLFIGMDKRM